MNSKSNEFISKIRITEDIERNKLLKLQKEYEDGIISEDEMTPKQILKLQELYDEQIKNLKIKFNDYKRKFYEMKNG